jgi:hypothetical protein
MVWFTKKGDLKAEMSLRCHCLSFKLTKNFAFEFNFLYSVRKFSDGVDWLDFAIDSDWYRGDHNPQFGVKLTILNLIIFDFRIYNVNHVEDDDA